MGRMDELLGYLPGYMRTDDSEQALRGLVGPLAAMEVYLELRKDRLPWLLDPANCPDELVPHLAALVGMGLDLAPANIASTDELRRLIQIAIPTWKKKGRNDAVRVLAAAIARSRVVLLDWFYRRAIENHTGEIVILPYESGEESSNYDHPENVMDVWYGDPDGSVNADLLHAMLNVVRPYNERYNVLRAWMVDDGLSGTALWTGSGTGTGRYDAERAEITATDYYQWVANLGGIEATWTNYLAWLRLGVTGLVDVLLYYTDSSNYYSVQIDGDARTVALVRRKSAANTTLVSAVPVSIAAAYPYLWRMEIYSYSSTTEIRVFLEATEVLTYLDVGSSRLTAGALGWVARLGTDNIASLSTAIIYPDGTAPTRVGPNP